MSSILSRRQLAIAIVFPALFVLSAAFFPRGDKAPSPPEPPQQAVGDGFRYLLKQGPETVVRGDETEKRLWKDDQIIDKQIWKPQKFIRGTETVLVSETEYEYLDGRRWRENEYDGRHNLQKSTEWFEGFHRITSYFPPGLPFYHAPIVQTVRDD